MDSARHKYFYFYTIISVKCSLYHLEIITVLIAESIKGQIKLIFLEVKELWNRKLMTRNYYKIVFFLEGNIFVSSRSNWILTK